MMICSVLVMFLAVGGIAIRPFLRRSLGFGGVTVTEPVVEAGAAVPTEAPAAVVGQLKGEVVVSTALPV